MIDYVSRQYLLDEYDRQHQGPPGGARKIIAEAPAEDVAPVVHAYWIPQKENNEFKEAWMKCSACGYPVSRWTGNTNFCPDCGAKMDAQREE